jgi:hypothetical protein
MSMKAESLRAEVPTIRCLARVWNTGSLRRKREVLKSTVPLSVEANDLIVEWLRTEVPRFGPDSSACITKFC